MLHNLSRNFERVNKMSLIKRPDQPQRKSISRAFRVSTVALNNNVTPLDILEGQLAGLADAFAGLQAKFENLQEVHSTFLTFNQSFSAFLHGIQMNAYCVEFPEVLYFLVGNLRAGIVYLYP